MTTPNSKSKNSVLAKYGYNPEQIEVKLHKAWQQIFYGDATEERVYFTHNDQEAYILSIDSQDIRSEGMSYGMMICVLLDKKDEFDALWRFSLRYMQHSEGERKGYFAWQLASNAPFAMLDPNPAPDGEEYFVTALLWAARKWGNGTDELHYQYHADTILHEMISKDLSDQQVPMFNKIHHQVVFTTDAQATPMTDPSYHLPAFYELWSHWASENKAFWTEAARVSRIFLRRCFHPRTGLTPNYANFDGSPFAATWVADHDHFGFDAFRTVMNIAMDFSWFKADSQQKEQAYNLLRFFSRQNEPQCQYTLEGTPLENSSPAIPALWAMNATAALCVDDTDLVRPYLQHFWSLKTPTGHYRYYNSMLYLLAFLHLSGHFENPLQDSK